MPCRDTHTRTAAAGAEVSAESPASTQARTASSRTPNASAPMMLIFCIAFGLSMDYEVFLLARIKEAHDAGAGTVEAVAAGLGRTGRIVTTAAALLVADGNGR